MIPGTQTRLTKSTVASADTISVRTDIIKVTGSTQINTILSPLMGTPMMVVLIPVDGAVVLGTTGNILVGITMAVNRAVWLVWDNTVGKWYINSGV